MLDGGRVLRNGPIAGLVDTGIVEVEIVGDPEPAARLLESRGATVERGPRVLSVSSDGDTYVLVRDAVAETATTIRRLGARSTSLEDVFLDAGRDTT